MHSKPIFSEHLFSTYVKSFFFFRLNLYPGRLQGRFVDSSRFTLWLLIVKFDNRRGIFSFLLVLWKKECLVLITFGELLVAKTYDLPLIYTSQFLVEIKSESVYFFGCKRDLNRVQTLLDQGDLKHFWDHWHIKEINGVLILIFEEFHISLGFYCRVYFCILFPVWSIAF